MEYQRQDIHCLINSLSQKSLFIGRSLAENITGDLRTVTGMTDAYSQTIEIPAATELSNGISKTVMSAVSSSLFQANGAGREIQLVVSDEDVFRFNFVETGQCSDGLPAFVHEGHGLEQPEFLAFREYFAGLAVELVFALEAAAIAAGYSLNKPKTGVVSRLLILRSGITQADNERDLRRQHRFSLLTAERGLLAFAGLFALFGFFAGAGFVNRSNRLVMVDAVQ